MRADLRSACKPPSAVARIAAEHAGSMDCHGTWRLENQKGHLVNKTTDARFDLLCTCWSQLKLGLLKGQVQGQEQGQARQKGQS